MPEAVQPQVRYRVNVSTSTKWVHTYDCTVELVQGWPEYSQSEGFDWLRDKILEESEKLVAALDIKYPAGNGG